jgi:hypothetical protein
MWRLAAGDLAFDYNALDMAAKELRSFELK